MDEYSGFGEPGREEQTRKVFSRVGFALSFVYAIVLVAGLLVGAVHANVARLPSWMHEALSNAAMYMVGFPLAMMLIRAPSEDEGLNGQSGGGALRLGPAQLGKLCVCAIAIMYIVNILTTLGLQLFTEVTGFDLSMPIDEILGGSSLWMSLVSVTLLAPVMEEMLFRGVLYRKTAHLGPRVAIGMNGVLFGLFHGNFNQMFYAMAIGMVLAAVMHYTGNLLYCILLHAVVNFAGGAMSLILMKLDSKLLLGLWGLIMLGMVVCGAVMAVGWMRRNGQNIRQDMASEGVSLRSIFVNPGMLIFLGVFCFWAIGLPILEMLWG